MSPRSCWVDIRFISSMSPLKESMQVLRLFLMVLKSPWYVSVILAGMSPLAIRST